MNIVLDTNVLVSALWSPSGKPAAILNVVISQRFTACYDHRILDEYNKVLRRPKFGFSEWEIACLLEPVVKNGISIIAKPCLEILFTDESDRKFYEVAKSCGASLVTGNTKHYPQDSCIATVADFYQLYFCGQ